MASEQRCRKPGCGALKIVGKPCADADCPQQWVHHTDTRPTPARCERLETVAYRYRHVDYVNWTYCESKYPRPDIRNEEIVTRQNAEEVIAAERMKLEASARVGLQLSEKIDALEADNASLIHDLNRIKDHETSLVNDNEAKNARIEELERRLKEVELEHTGVRNSYFAEKRKASALEADNKRLREVLVMSEAAISEFYRYQYGGEMRGSYDGKPERDGLWKAMYQARAALGEQSE